MGKKKPAKDKAKVAKSASVIVPKRSVSKTAQPDVLEMLEMAQKSSMKVQEEAGDDLKVAAMSALMMIGSKSKAALVSASGEIKAVSEPKIISSDTKAASQTKSDIRVSGSKSAIPKSKSQLAAMESKVSSSQLLSETASKMRPDYSRISVGDEDDESESSDEEYEITTKKTKGKRGKKKGKEEPVVVADEEGKKKKKEKGEGEEGEEPEKEEKKGKKKKKKKKKKGDKKKGKKPGKPTKADEKAALAMFWVNELKRLRALAAEMGVVDPEAKPEEKKGPKKKLSKKEKAKIAAEKAEKEKAEAEAQCKRLLELMRIKMEEDKKAAIEKDKRELIEQTWRMEQLELSANIVREMLEFNAQLQNQEKEEAEWEKFVACGKLPIPALCPQMNTYLHLWELDMEATSVEQASRRTVDVITLLDELEELIDTAHDVKPETLENWYWIRSLFREHQEQNLDVATYNLLRDVEKNLNRIDIPTADFNFKDDNITLCIWLRVMLPKPLPNPRRPPKPRIDITFELTDMRVLLPLALDGEDVAIRAMYLKYDHLSDTSSNFYMPPVPQEYYRDLYDTMKREWRSKLFYKYQHRDKLPPKEPEEGEEIVPEKEEFESDEEIQAVPFKQLKPTGSQTVISTEDQLYQKTREYLTLVLPPDVINLRKFSIIGGIYYLNLLAQPPQPQDFITMEMQLTGFYLPKQLETVPYSVTYTPPEPAPQSSDPEFRRLPEEIEEEMKKQEEELDKLISITLTWPQHVIFLELPIVCRWDEENKVWTNDDIHDLKHNEEKFVLSFRTGSFGIFALASYRYANLPYQAYEIKPEADGSVTLQLTAAILMLEFNIKDGLICITQLQNSPNMALQDLIGSYMKLHQLTKVMKEAGIDIFPAFDAFCYVEANAEKQWAMEKHLYNNMAQMSNSFNFAWSRWNMQAGRRKIVMQMRHYQPLKPKQKNHYMLLVTPEKATFVDCTEVSQTFSEKDSEVVIKFSADLFNLMKSTHTIAIRNAVLQNQKENVYILAEFLFATRILSFS